MHYSVVAKDLLKKISVFLKGFREPFVTCLKSLDLAEQPLGDGISTKQLEDARCSLMVAVREMPTTLEPRVNANRNV